MSLPGGARLYPVGQRLGELHEDGAGSRGVVVATGERAVLVEDGDRADAWDAAHGLGHLVRHVAWDRSQLGGVLGGLPSSDLDRVVADLLDRGLVAEVDPRDPAATERFLTGHRWTSRLGGLGQQERPGGFVCGIGVPGAPPVREVSPRVYEFWSLAPELPTLAAAADFLAASAVDDAGVEPEETDPAAVRLALLDWLHDLLCVGAGWLEVVR